MTTTIQRALTRPVRKEGEASLDAAPVVAQATRPVVAEQASRTSPTVEQQRQGRARASSVESALRAQRDARATVSNDALGATRIAVHSAVRNAVDRGADAVEITRVAHQTATDSVTRTSPHASKQERADAAMAVATHALIGSDHIKSLTDVDSGRTSMVKYLHVVSGLNARDVERKWESPLDKTVGKGDLEPRFDDSTNGQPFHIGFFTAAGYVAAGNPVKQGLVAAAALYHETLEPAAFVTTGNSRRDYVASMYGAAAGEQMKRARDRGDGDLIPAMSVGLMAKDGVLPPAAGLSPERHRAAIDAAATVRAQRASWINQAVIDNNSSTNTLIGAVKLAQKIWKR